MIELKVSTERKEHWLNITARVQQAVDQAGLDAGVCVVSVPHTTAGVTIQENADPDVVVDCLLALDHMVPASLPFRHAEGNSTAHVKTVLTGSSISVPVAGGRLALGTWQGVFLCEFDGPRQRRVWINLLAEAVGDRR